MRRIILALLLCSLCISTSAAQTTQPVNLFNDDKIRLIIRADDFEAACRVVTRTEKHLGVEFQ